MYPVGSFHFTYVNPLCNEYDNFERYRAEASRLYDTLCSLDIQKNTLFQLIIGAAAEEMINTVDIGKQWRQLFPNHIDIVLADYDIPIIVMIISPNVEITDEYIPMFIQKTILKYKWVKNGMTFESTSKNVKVYMFNTLMPHKDDRFLNVVNNIHRIVPIDEQEHIKKNYIQTEIDVIFINNFYQTLNKVFDAISFIGGYIICYSFAVFRHDSCYNIYNNFNMFNEITELFKGANRLLCEWTYTMKFDVYYVTKYNTSTRINYAYNCGSEEHNLFITLTDGKLNIDIL